MRLLAVDATDCRSQPEAVSATEGPGDDASPIQNADGLWRRHRWMTCTLAGFAVIGVALAANEIYLARTAASVRKRANAAIDSIPVPAWMVEADRIETGFACHPWSDCQERFLTVVYDVDIDRATASERQHPCDSLLAALGSWAPDDAGTGCWVHAARDGSTLAAGIFEHEGGQSISRDAILDGGAHVMIAIYP